ncbi:MAG: hemerythrin domain-containing protein [Flavobacteriaceae bacterium]
MMMSDFEGKAPGRASGTPVAAGPEREDLPDAIKEMRRLHWLKLAICTELEALADGLPERLSPAHCAALQRRVCRELKEAHRFEEDVVFPLILDRARQPETAAANVRRLRMQHIEDEGHADEIAEHLRALATDPHSLDAETLGYALRGFFACVRRHIAFEEECIRSLSAGEEER